MKCWIQNVIYVGKGMVIRLHWCIWRRIKRFLKVHSSIKAFLQATSKRKSCNGYLLVLSAWVIEFSCYLPVSGLQVDAELEIPLFPVSFSLHKTSLLILLIYLLFFYFFIIKMVYSGSFVCHIGCSLLGSTQMSLFI